PAGQIAGGLFRPDERITQQVACDDLREGDRRESADQDGDDDGLDARHGTIEAERDRPQALHLAASTILLTRSGPSRSDSSLSVCCPAAVNGASAGSVTAMPAAR